MNLIKGVYSQWSGHQALAVRSASSVEMLLFSGATRSFFRRTGLEPPVFPLHPQLFQIKCHGQQEQFPAYISLSFSTGPGRDIQNNFHSGTRQWL